MSDGGRELRLLRIVPSIVEIQDVTNYQGFSNMRREQLKRAQDDLVLQQAAEILKRRELENIDG